VSALEVAFGSGLLVALVAVVGLELVAARRWRELSSILSRIEAAVTDLDELEAAHELDLELDLDDSDP
jgi:hypothetical protein